MPPFYLYNYPTYFNSRIKQVIYIGTCYFAVDDFVEVRYLYIEPQRQLLRFVVMQMHDLMMASPVVATVDPKDVLSYVQIVKRDAHAYIHAGFPYTDDVDHILNIASESCAAMCIQRAWKRRTSRQFLTWALRKLKVMHELKLYPSIGIEYQLAKERFMNRL